MRTSELHAGGAKVPCHAAFAYEGNPAPRKGIRRSSISSETIANPSHGAGQDRAALLAGDDKYLAILSSPAPEADIETLIRQDGRGVGFLSDRHIRRDGPGV